MKNWLKIILVGGLFLGISVFVNLKYSGLLDPDTFYHVRHAWIYRTNGIFDSSFPWTYFSMIRVLGADLWYGFHVLLIPFTYADDLTSIFKTISILITFSVLVSLYWALKNIDIKFPGLWTIFFLFSSSPIIKRMTMARPHPLSLGLTALIISFFIKGPATLVFIFSFLLSWIHSSIFWFPVLAVSLVVIFQKLNGKEIDSRKIIAFAGGILGGLMARPHPLANLKLIYIQIVDLYLSKGHELAQTIGGELKPPPLEEFYDQKWLFVFFIIACIYLGRGIYGKASVLSIRKAWDNIDQKIIIASSLAMTIFSGLMYKMARRAIDQLTLSITIFTGAIFCYFIFSGHNFRGQSKKKTRKDYLATMLLFFAIISLSVYNFIQTDFSRAQPLTKFKEPALWLKENAKDGEIIFYSNWGYFPFLFFWNQDNNYIYGMDPIFLLKYDERLYWKLYNMIVNQSDKKAYWSLNNMELKDVSGVTCGYDPKKCRLEDIEAVSDVLRKDFHASYVLVSDKVDFADYLNKDKENFEKVYENNKENILIFKLL